MPEISFFDSINRPELKEKITPQSPWAYFSLEAGLPGLSLSGGLGILAGDTYLQAKLAKIPFILVTLLYPVGWETRLDYFYQAEHYFSNNPLEQNFSHALSLQIRANDIDVPLDVFVRREESAMIVGLYDPGLRELYADSTTSQHRMFQEAVLGFGGFKALQKLDYTPRILHLNEAATVFVALASVDALITSGIPFDEALDKVRKQSIFTNHTLLSSAVASFSEEYYERYILVNIYSDPLKKWLRDLLKKKKGTLRRTSIAIRLCANLNGVSKLHSKIATEDIKKEEEGVQFIPVTNGIYLTRWTHQDFLKLYHETQILSEYDCLNNKYLDMVSSWTEDELLSIKKKAKRELVSYLTKRVDQNGNPIHISQHAKFAVWAKRFSGYKRPDMIFANIDRLLRLIQKEDLYILLAGSVHPGDVVQKQQLKSILSAVDANPVLAEKVFYIQRYDIELASYLSKGADIWLNLPEVGKEACGTSWMKAVANLAILISTKDGGVADLPDDSYLQVCEGSYNEEVECLYNHLEKACKILNNPIPWREFVIKQLKESLSVLSAGRMIEDYLNLVYRHKF